MHRPQCRGEEEGLTEGARADSEEEHSPYQALRHLCSRKRAHVVASIARQVIAVDVQYRIM